MENSLKQIVKAQKAGKAVGIYSCCSANEYVVKAALLKGKEDNSCVLIESTANQCDQYGGYTGMKPADFKNFVEGICDEVGFDEIKKKVVNPLTGKKIGAYYGCLLLRPGKIMAFDNPENPTIMEDFIRALGAEPVVYPYRNECCGGYISLKEKEMAQNMCEKIMDSAKGFEADMLITACPLCMYNLKKNGNGDLPVYYFTELLAEALGVKEEVAK